MQQQALGKEPNAAKTNCCTNTKNTDLEDGNPESDGSSLEDDVAMDTFKNHVTKKLIEEIFGGSLWAVSESLCIHLYSAHDITLRGIVSCARGLFFVRNTM